MKVKILKEFRQNLIGFWSKSYRILAKVLTDFGQIFQGFCKYLKAIWLVS